MHDVHLPGEVGKYDLELSVMDEMGWGWRQLCEAPADLVEEIYTRLCARSKWTKEKKRIDDALNAQRNAAAGVKR